MQIYRKLHSIPAIQGILFHYHIHGRTATADPNPRADRAQIVWARS